MDQLNLGIVGACRRGASFKAGCDTLDNVHIKAVCDTNEDDLEEAKQRLGADQSYVHYDDMLEKANLDAVVIATPMHLHAAQIIQALQQNIHVLSEVTAAISIDECRDLVAACKSSRAKYMLAENCNYSRANLVVRELVHQGLFGTTYFADGQYVHDVQQISEATPWRRRWQTGIDGITYGSHALGPLLQWLPNDRVVAVCCAGSGHHYRDPRNAPYAQDTSLMLGKMQSGGIVKVRCDLISHRPSITASWQLQGTEGCYESGRAPGEKNRIWLKSRCPDQNTWLDLAELEEEFLPAIWREAGGAVNLGGHGGSDLFTIIEFVDAIRENRPPDIGIHKAMDMTLPGLVSQQSIAHDGEWMNVPDSRQW